MMVGTIFIECAEKADDVTSKRKEGALWISAEELSKQWEPWIQGPTVRYAYQANVQLVRIWWEMRSETQGKEKREKDWMLQGLLAVGTHHGV